jgi:hypothetical protein
MLDRDALVEAWSDRDRGRAVLPADRAVIEASATIRALIVDLALTCLAGGPEDELYDACAVLGRFIGQRAGSPTLASATLDHAAEVLGARSAAWVVPARAAVVEGFAAVVVEVTWIEALRTWEFPGCAVALGQAALAIAAGHPSDDEEVLAGWAARIASAAALAGVRRAVVSGNALATAAVVDALGLVGIEVNAASRSL